MLRTLLAGAARPLAAGCMLALLAGPLAAAEDEVIATVDGTAITESELALAAQDYAQELAQVPETMRRNLLVGVLVDMHVLANAAIKAGREDDPAVKAQLEYVRLRTLRDSYFGDGNSLEPDEAELKAAYEARVAAHEGTEERHARHILVKTKEEAEALIKELEGGKDFAELAKEKSTGPSGPSGGDLGYFTRDRMVKPFADAAFAMEVGSHSKEPVESQFGWHVIKVEDAREQPAPTFDALKNELRTEAIRAKYNAEMEKLKTAAEIDIVAPAEAAAESDPVTETPDETTPAQ